VYAFSNSPHASLFCYRRSLPVVIFLSFFIIVNSTDQLVADTDACSCWCQPLHANVLPFASPKDLVCRCTCTLQVTKYESSVCISISSFSRLLISVKFLLPWMWNWRATTTWAVCGKQDLHNICIIYILSISANCNLPFQCQKVDNIQQLDSWYQLCCGAIRIGRHLLQDPEED